MFYKYYQEELSFLRELGREFSLAHPAAAHFLTEAGSDPDVERLLEGFAFLTGRIREKLDDELPELTSTFLGLLWPHYLRSVPAMTIVTFEPIPGAIAGVQTIPAGTELDTTPIEGTPVRFRTAYDTDVYPFAVKDAALLSPPGERARLVLTFKLDAKAKFEDAVPDRIRFHLHGDVTVTRTLYLYLVRYLHRTVVRPARQSESVELPSDCLRPVGFEEDHALLPYPVESFRGYRLLQEYFALPEKFLFFDITGLDQARGLPVEEEFEVIFEFNDPPEAQIRVTDDNIRLSATPVVNLFPHNCDPIRVEHERAEYRLRPAGRDPDHYEIYSVDGVQGMVQGTAERRTFKPFYSFDHGLGPGQQNTVFYEAQLRQSVIGEGTDSYLSFVTGLEEGTTPPAEIISVELTCTNRRLPERLQLGEVSVPTSTSPEFATFKNIRPVSPSARPPLGEGLHWRLISHLALNHLSLDSKENFRGLLELYNFRALYDRQAARQGELLLRGIEHVSWEPEEWFHRGTLIRGRRTTIEMREENYSCEGEMLLLASVLEVFLGLYTTMNSFSRLRVKGLTHKEVYEWPPRAGHQILL